MLLINFCLPLIEAVAGTRYNSGIVGKLYNKNNIFLENRERKNQAGKEIKT